MRIFAIAFIAALGLAGCASTDLSPQLQVYQLQRQLDDSIAEIEVYAAQPECTDAVVVACHDPEAVDYAVMAAKEADSALDQAEAAVRAGGTDVAVYIDLARSALARIALYIAAKEAA